MILLLSLITLYHIKNNKCVLIIGNLIQNQNLHSCVPTFVPTRSHSGREAYEHKKGPLENQGFQVVGLVGLEPMTSTMSTTRKPLFYNKKWWAFDCDVCFVIGENECREA